jgi:membrane protein DedA with SNARE-associated domain
MIETLLHTIITWIQSIGWMGVFLGSVLEEIFPPIPSTLTQLTYGALLLGDIPISGTLIVKSLLLVGLPAAVGVLVGSLPFYAIGYFFGKPFIERWGKWLGVRWEAILKLEQRFKQNAWDDIIFTGLRAIPLIPSIVLSIGPGVLRLPFRTYALGTFIGTFIRASIMGFAGGLIGSQVDTVAEMIDHTGNVGLVIFAISCMIGLWWMLKTKKKSSKNN